MHTVIDTAQLSPNVTRLVIEAPRIAKTVTTRLERAPKATGSQSCCRPAPVANRIMASSQTTSGW